MRGLQKLLGAVTLFGLGLLVMLSPPRAASHSTDGAAQSGGAEPVPAYHTELPPGALPPTLSPSEFADPVVKNAYSVAARIKKTLYREPCYCHCDQSQGHGSLLDCYVSKHAAGCGICISEDFYAYEQARKGKSASQIREGIIRGEWQHVDLTKYQAPLPRK
jgi:Protein of unknown function with PCYCGC motif